MTSSDVENLAEYLGFLDPQYLLDNWDQVGPMMSNALKEGEEAFQRLNEAAFLNITGTSTADFSALQNGLLSVQGLAEDTINMLLATGQWELHTENTEQLAWVKSGDSWIQQTLSGFQQYLVPTGKNPFKTGSGGGGGDTKKKSGGGSGGGGSKKTGPSEVEIVLDRMDQVQDLQNHTRSLYSKQANYYAQTGQLQGVIKYYEKEIEVIKKQNETLEDNVAELDD